MLTSSIIAIVLAALAILAVLPSTMTVAYSQYGGTGGSVGTASPEQLQECDQLGIPTENCNDVTILAKKRLNAAQLETGNNNGSGSFTFQSSVDGIRVQVPSGWVVEDIDNTDRDEQKLSRDLGWELLATLCPQEQTLPKIGGGYVCSDGAEDYVNVIRYAELKSRPEFAVLAQQNKSITISDLLAYFIQYDEVELNYTNHILHANIDRLVNVTDSHTNQTIATASAKYVEMSFSNAEGERVESGISLLVLNNDGNTGYVLLPTSASELTTAGELSPEYQQILDSFGLLYAPNSSGIASALPSLTTPTLTILKGSSIQGSPDYGPDELTVAAGSEVTVVNQDTLPHTVTSGTSPTDPNSAQTFDTSLINGGESATLSLAQVAAGQYHYYCMVHPYMTGMITMGTSE
jgi:plastocyanin